MRQPPRRRKLTDFFVRTVEPEAKRAVYWDTLQTGPGLKVQPTGTKTFVAVYRHAGKPR